MSKLEWNGKLWLAGLAACTILMSGCEKNVTPQGNTASDEQEWMSADFEPSDTWSNSQKQGIGTSYEAYDANGAFSSEAVTGPVSKVWYSAAHGKITEVMYGLIHAAQIRDWRFVVKGPDFVHTEDRDMISSVHFLDTDSQGRPLSPALVIRSHDKANSYELVKTILTDPDRNTLLVKVDFIPKRAGLQLETIVDPHMANTSGGDAGAVNSEYLESWEGDAHLAVSSDQTFVAPALRAREGGKILLGAQLPRANKDQAQHFLFAMGFGKDAHAARAAARGTLDAGFDAVHDKFLGKGGAVGWEDYLASLSELPALQKEAEDGGKLVNASAIVLKSQEDKTYAGALIASLSNPWGDTTSAEKFSSGYKAVWPRDFYQCAMAFLALGDAQTAKRAFEYLPKVQVTDATPGNKGATGWFLQKTLVNGQLEWVAVQLDQTAMPIMLGWKLWKAGDLSDAEMQKYYDQMIRPAADFLVKGGKPNLLWNTDFDVKPPMTQQERWEEQWGYSPSTTAAVITGLITAADMAEHFGDAASAKVWRDTADMMNKEIEPIMFTTDGKFGNGRYFVRISRTKHANDHEKLGKANGHEGLPSDEMVDGGFLELVRYGVRSADAPSITDSLPELDGQARDPNLVVLYSFRDGKEVIPGWRRYGNDGYGESTDGFNYGEGGKMRPTQRGRVWPFFTGERGHYELARDLLKGPLTPAEHEHLRKVYVRGMEHFANAGDMLPEQVFDGVGQNPWHYKRGQGTNSATPLAWTHAEYVKLLRSLHDGQVWDRYDIVADRYQKKGQ